jgi:hypothetical protein
MRTNKDQKPGYSKILDAWVPPEEAGDPIGCVATSFTFSAPFFEQECLGRFVQLETDASEDGPAHLIEREEKLCQLACAAALVDQHHARGVRSLRWDLLPARVAHGILHAKISLLFWRNHARLIVASANLTEDGYRRNHEVFGVLDYFQGSDSPLQALDETLVFLGDAVTHVQPAAGGATPALTRWTAFLDRVSKTSRHWGATEPSRWLGGLRAVAILTGPGRANVLTTLRERWPGSSPPETAFVISPFYDPPEAPNEPAKQLWALLKQRGDARVEFQVEVDEIPGKKALFVHAPKSILEAQPANRTGTETTIARLTLEPSRPLHAKCLWLENESIAVSMAGSSNFTSPGLGLGTTKNLEANLAFAAAQDNREATRALTDAWLPNEEIPSDFKLQWQPRPDEGEDSPGVGLVPLPPAFGSANLGLDAEQRTFIELGFPAAPPQKWALYVEDETEVFFDETAWQAKAGPPQIRLPWSRDRAPSGFRVTWQDSGGAAWWPVNVVNGEVLPPPAELKNLPLDVLIDILTSAKPLHRAMEAWLRRQREKSAGPQQPALDPLKRVDTSAFLLQRTRRVSDALTALRHRLQRPTASEQALAWRLRGPVGVLAVAQAIVKEAKSEHERCFLLTELCLELARVRPQTSPGALSPQHVRSSLRDLITEIRATIPTDALASLPALAEYTNTAFKEVLA